MRWFLPSWNGDVRAESDGEKTQLTIIDPTAHEQEVLKLLEKIFRNKKWYEGDEPLWLNPNKVSTPPDKKEEELAAPLGNNVPGNVFNLKEGDPYRAPPVQCKRTIDAPLSEVAPLLVKGYKPGEATLTAVILKDGHVETVSGSGPDLDALAKMAEEKKAEAAATVKRPTPSCPQCHPGAIDPATEVLLTFLDEHQHAQWASDRCIMVRGHLSGHRYLISHRHSDRAQHQGKICVDLDDQTVLHFHDHSVPPEEEVLAAKLCLEHREPWLRNEATVLGTPYEEHGRRSFREGRLLKYKNPFGDGGDGVPDAGFTMGLGASLVRTAEQLLRAKR